MEDNVLKLSVIVPVYNVEKYIHRCVDSLLKQSYTNIEIILVDDGSEDDSPAICDKYAQENNNVRVIHKSNGGLSSARNVGLQHATGELIGFVDSDDYIHPDMYKCLVHNILEYDADVSNCKALYVRNNKVPKVMQYANQDVECYNNIEMLKLGLLKDPMYIDCACNNIYRKELWKNINFPIGMYHEDRATIFKTIYASNKIVHTNFQGYYYCQREGSITNSTYSCRHAMDQLKAMDIKFEMLSGNEQLKNIVKVKGAIECIDIWTNLAISSGKNIQVLNRIKNKFKQYFNFQYMVKYSDIFHIIGSFIFSINPNVYLFIYLRARKVYYKIRRTDLG